LEFFVLYYLNIGFLLSTPPPFTSQPPFPGVQICVFLFSIFFLFILTWVRLEKIIVVISCSFLLVLLITYLQKNVFKYTRAKKDLSNFLMKYWHTIFLPIPFLNGLCQVQVLLNSKWCFDDFCLSVIFWPRLIKYYFKKNSSHVLAHFYYNLILFNFDSTYPIWFSF
jgi:hypothetical protein